YGKAEIRARIQAVTARSIQELAADEVSAVGFKPAVVEAMDEQARARELPKFRRDEDIHIVVAGAEAGKFSGAFHGWVTGEIGSMPVSKIIEEA
ncbi:MAG: TlpA family protein disulfide reductase, partial [Gammaproteobacteria bacterium]|nr:TlpA family protein disulfide reductase [Gammaproteobacteria bacterium]